MNTRVLITGVTGFVGGHLAEALVARGGATLHGLSRGGTWPAELRNLERAVKLHAVDLGDRLAIERVLEVVQPDWIFHLAGYAHTGHSFQEPDLAWAGNLDATRNLYEAVIRWGGSPRLLFVSTGLIYGAGENIDEQAPLRPASPYAASKAAADLASAQYARHPGLDIVIARPFNHVGPRQSPEYVVARFASQIAAIERGQQPPVVETGDLDSARDFTDVRDVVRGYVLLLEKGRRGEAYNVGSGIALEIGAVLDCLAQIVHGCFDVRTRPDTRPEEKTVLVANASKLTNEIGWRSMIDFDQTLRDTLEYWRRKLTA